jgi:hypothetical protein
VPVRGNRPDFVDCGRAGAARNQQCLLAMSKPAVLPLMDTLEFQEQLKRLVDAPPSSPDRATTRPPMNAFGSLTTPAEENPRPEHAGHAPETAPVMWSTDRAERDALSKESEERDGPSLAAPGRLTTLVVMLGAAAGASMSAAIFHGRLAHVIAHLAR